jgi:hypothetical protein
MFKIILKANTKSIDDFLKFKKDIRKEVIEKGLDSRLSESVKELKSSLLTTIVSDIKYKKTYESQSDLEAPVIDVNIPRSQKEILNHLFDVDLDKLNRNKDFTTFGESKAVLIKDNRVILKIQESPFSTLNESYEKAVNFFKQAVFIDFSGNKVRYLVPKENFDIKKWVKIYCSPQTGIEGRAQRRFTDFQKTGKSEWRLKQDGVKEFLRQSIDISEIADSVILGDYEKAEKLLRERPSLKNKTEVYKKIENLKTNKNVNVHTQAFSGIVKLINGIKIQKIKTDKKVEYKFISTYSDISQNIDTLLSEIDRNLVIWFGAKTDEWFYTLVRKAEKVIKDYEQKGK